jgi:hypothetical protein
MILSVLQPGVGAAGMEEEASDVGPRGGQQAFLPSSPRGFELAIARRFMT